MSIGRQLKLVKAMKLLIDEIMDRAAAQAMQELEIEPTTENIREFVSNYAPVFNDLQAHATEALVIFLNKETGCTATTMRDFYIGMQIHGDPAVVVEEMNRED